MGLMNAIFGERITYEVDIKYKCRNCGEIIDRGKELITLKLENNDKADNDDAILRKTAEWLLSPQSVSGFIIPYAPTNSTFMPINMHRCKDGSIGMCELASFKITE
jgi:hypothetical protein